MVDKYLELNYSKCDIQLSESCRSRDCNVCKVMLCKDHYQQWLVQPECSSHLCCLSCQVTYGNSNKRTVQFCFFRAVCNQPHKSDRFWFGGENGSCKILFWHSDTYEYCIKHYLKCQQLQRHDHATEVMCEKSDVAETWTSVNDAHTWIINCAVISFYLWLTLQQRSV
jgi:hypothetical protein